MDIQRAILRACFYDYPIARFIELLFSETINGKSYFKKYIDLLPSILKNQMAAFTLGETAQITKALKSKWYCGTYAAIAEYARPFMYMATICNDLLTVDASNIPFVRYENLLRWRELTLLLGEELPICAYLALENRGNIGYLWPDTLHHQKESVNKILREIEKCDLHVHLDASANAFDLTWIYRMNKNSGGRIPDEIAVELFGEFDERWLNVSMIIRYWMYKLTFDNVSPSDYDIKRLLLSLRDDDDNLKFITDSVKDDIDSLSMETMRVNGIHPIIWDYAISRNDISAENSIHPESLMYGERKLLCTYLGKLFKQKGQKSDIQKFSGLAYLYCLLKINCRKHMILTNGHVGLANYQRIQKNLSLFTNDIEDIRLRYAIQTSKGMSGNDGLEARIAFENSEKFHLMATTNVSLPFVGEQEYTPIANGREERVTLVVSISKPKAETQKRLREGIEESIIQIDEVMGTCYGHTAKGLQLVGFDIAGSDTNCTPYQLAPIVNKMRVMGCENITYHCGEDFYDLLDGLHSIYSVLYELNWNSPNRLAHLSALYTSVQFYYEKRKLNVVIPAQRLYDNLVWLLLEADRRRFRLDCRELIQATLDELIRQYKDISNKEKENLDDYNKCQEAYFWKCPGTERLYRLMSNIQESIKKEIKERKIHIESCPTSNYLIGYFNSYNETPYCQIARTFEQQSTYNVSVNTDARAILATSLDNEYSLVSIAMRKAHDSDRIIIQRLKKSAKDSMNARFMVKKEVY